MTSKIYYHVYVSSAVDLMSSDELLKLLTVSRNNNSQIGITGMLLHKDGNFIQAIEGPEDQVRKLLEKIRKDSRHRGVITLVEGYTDQRQFDTPFFLKDCKGKGKVVFGISVMANTKDAGAPHPDG